ncbi:hypothetical protein HW49_06030 [Porphyromonadaceae bacterium COT-184 OH4590]|nr:hypothetical protein HW49_06030 [Porphyromonadaceae bacterium COT-184 OH4590]
MELDGLMKINNEGMKVVKGGYTLHTVTVTPKEKQLKENSLSDCPDHGTGNCDGDDGVAND